MTATHKDWHVMTQKGQHIKSTNRPATTPPILIIILTSEDVYYKLAVRKISVHYLEKLQS